MDLEYFNMVSLDECNGHTPLLIQSVTILKHIKATYKPSGGYIALRQAKFAGSIPASVLQYVNIRVWFNCEYDNKGPCLSVTGRTEITQLQGVGFATRSLDCAEFVNYTLMFTQK